MKLLGIIAAVVLVLDQASKWVVVQGLGLKSVGWIDLWPPYLTFRMAWNQGVNFGLLSGSSETVRWALIVLAVVISGFVLWWVRAEPGNRMAQISGGILIGGAIGNIIDRLIYGAVADFLNMSCCGLENPYVFNVADIAIFIGAVGLVLFTGGKGKRPPVKGKSGHKTP